MPLVAAVVGAEVAAAAADVLSVVAAAVDAAAAADVDVVAAAGAAVRTDAENHASEIQTWERGSVMVWPAVSQHCLSKAKRDFADGRLLSKTSIKHPMHS